jgi:hypothetical protein
VSQAGVEVLTRGPVHEAFAETIAFDPQPGVVIPQTPPALIEEIPPAQRPAGDNVAWIPGYWGWDDERNDFLWISGVWRSLPPGRQWVPGYWAQSGPGAQWTSGYWADAEINEIEYLPEPPATVESGPNSAAPNPGNIWLPGYWDWQQNRYAWRPGYWAEGNQNWDWVPAHYVWTPSGYVFVNGYYDYDVPRRGIVFAPVYFNGGLRTQPGFIYSPSAVINSSVFERYLFVRPNYGHYYFGDYYGSNYANAGFSPWFSYQSSRLGYDPIYANQRWQNRNNPAWDQQLAANFKNLRDNKNARPPRTWASQATLRGQATAGNQRDIAVAARLSELTKQQEGRRQFQSVGAAERQQLDQRRQQYRNYLQQRQQSEARKATPVSGDAAAAAAVRRTIARSPFLAPPTDKLGRDYTPPPRHPLPNPDPRIQPHSRTRPDSSGLQPGFQPGGGSGSVGKQVRPRVQPQTQSAKSDNGSGASRGGTKPQGPSNSGTRAGKPPQQKPSQNKSDDKNKKK